ncbi:MAG: hypothetical protein LUG99_14515 [Lachnospiraceae bacterium]|nr:hypothetical protein [Lachnospiraceae bacterium]
MFTDTRYYFTETGRKCKHFYDISGILFETNIVWTILAVQSSGFSVAAAFSYGAGDASKVEKGNDFKTEADPSAR